MKRIAYFINILHGSSRITLCCLLATAVAGCGGGSNNTSVAISGTITGLTEIGLVLSNGISNVALGAGATAFTFPSRVVIGAPYAVRPSLLPPNLLCTVANSTGVAGADASDRVQVSCVPRHTLGGTITGLTAAGLVLANGSDTVQLPAGAQSFALTAKVGEGSSYGVTVLQQPTLLHCDVAINSSGVMGVSDINNVQVHCN